MMSSAHQKRTRLQQAFDMLQYLFTNDYKHQPVHLCHFARIINRELVWGFWGRVHILTVAVTHEEADGSQRIYEGELFVTEEAYELLKEETDIMVQYRLPRPGVYHRVPEITLLR